MNKNEIKQRLLEAALTDEIPETPTFRYPHAVPRRLPGWAAFGAAASIAAAIALPMLLKHPQPELTAETLLMTDDPTLELECAFAMVNQHFNESANLIDFIQ